MENVQSVCNDATVSLYTAATSFQSNGNLMISPLSIVYATLLVYLGARGNTRTNLDDSLHFSDYFTGSNSSDAIVSAFADVITQLKLTTFDAPKAITSNSARNSSKTRPTSAPTATEAMLFKQGDAYQLAMANAVFVQDTFKLDQNYVSNVTRYLRASITTENFIKTPEVARQDINSWVDARTGGKIKDLLPQGAVDATTKAVLVNAVYFKAKWENEFQAKLTKKNSFTTLSGKKSVVDFMQMTRALTYAEDTQRGLQYLEIPYAGFEASLLVILPRKMDGLRGLEKNLTAELFGRLSSDSSDESQIDLSLPKFKTESTFDLKGLLKKIGVDDVFTMNADLSGIAPTGNLQVSNAFHKTFIDVNEKGTEAAAASAAVISTKMSMFQGRPLLPPIIFNADHPFIYAIRHNPTNLIVFIGRVESV